LFSPWICNRIYQGAWGCINQYKLCVSQEKNIIEMHHMLRTASSKKMYDKILKTHWHTQNAQAIYDQSAIKKKNYAQKNP